MTGGPFATVAVCTRNRAALLDACLRSLLAQSVEPRLYRVLVVDNGSQDATRAVVERHAAADARVDYAWEGEPGIAVARNRALAAVATPLIAFIDDDATARADWLERLAAPFAKVSPRPTAVGGEVDPVWTAPRPPWLSDDLLTFYSASMRLAGAPRFIVEGEWIFEGNCMVDCDALRSVGGFPAALGRRDGSLLSSENLAYERLRQTGHGIWFEPAARIAHLIHADRLNLRWLRRRVFWQGVSQSRCHRELHRLGLKVARPQLTVPTSFAHWRAQIQASEAMENVAEMVTHLYGLGYVFDQLELMDR
ncbi:MAG: glycosyltransferase family 2 protein [Alphaproteobacteria bacterium]|nr:glycosyltransferase family 2 protein [Alphaproteobacteria bacterium]